MTIRPSERPRSPAASCVDRWAPSRQPCKQAFSEPCFQPCKQGRRRIHAQRGLVLALVPQPIKPPKERVPQSAKRPRSGGIVGECERMGSCIDADSNGGDLVFVAHRQSKSGRIELVEMAVQADAPKIKKDLARRYHGDTGLDDRGRLSPFRIVVRDVQRSVGRRFFPARIPRRDASCGSRAGHPDLCSSNATLREKPEMVRALRAPRIRPLLDGGEAAGPASVFKLLIHEGKRYPAHERM